MGKSFSKTEAMTTREGLKIQLCHIDNYQFFREPIEGVKLLSIKSDEEQRIKFCCYYFYIFINKSFH